MRACRNREIYKILTYFMITNLEPCVTLMKVLFVCSGNAFRSPVAEALLKNQRPDVDVDSAGANPVVPDGIAGSARKYLAKSFAVNVGVNKNRKWGGFRAPIFSNGYFEFMHMHACDLENMEAEEEC